MGPISRTPKKTERHRNAVSYDPTAGEPPADASPDAAVQYSPNPCPFRASAGEPPASQVGPSQVTQTNPAFDFRLKQNQSKQP